VARRPAPQRSRRGWIEIIPRLDAVVVLSSEVNEKDPHDSELLCFLVRGVIVPTLR
jgi:hypothetical protein